MALLGEARAFRHRPLSQREDEIRLLEVRPSSTDNVEEPIICRLVHKRISESRQYIALSVLYGDAGKTECILLNGVEVAIPLQLSQALRHIRAAFFLQCQPEPRLSVPRFHGQKNFEYSSTVLRKKPQHWLLDLIKHTRDTLVNSAVRSSPSSLYVWIDLLCINTRDIREASERRSHLALAYHNAALVVGWLGPRDETSDVAIEIIRAWDACIPESFGKPGDREVHPENYAPTLQWMQPVAHLSEVPQGITDPQDVPSYKAISRFLNRPFFHNAWLLNEMSLAQFPAFLLGDDIVSWMQILRLNCVNEEICDHGAHMFPDELRHLLHYMPLCSVFTFLEAFDRHHQQNCQE